MHWTLLSCCASDPTLEETPMKSITWLVTAVVAVIFAVATLCPAQDVKPTDLGKGAAFNGKKIEIKDKGEVAYLLSFTAGKELEATTDGLKNTDVHLFVYDSSGACRVSSSLRTLPHSVKLIQRPSGRRSRTAPSLDETERSLDALTGLPRL